MTTAIRPQHLQRPAYVYLRQSTPGQVHAHRESTERQYALAERALELGWDRSQVHILDQDLGKSGTTTEGRTDFHRLMAAVGLGEGGAVLALEASRLSRSQADWHKLMDICALTDTLIVDQDGIYDPNAALHQKSLLHRIFRYKNRALWSRKSLQNEAKKVLLTDGSAC